MTPAPIPYGRQSVDESDIAAVVEVLESEWLTTGPAVTAFEDALLKVSGGHPVVAVSSGTAALHAAYAAAGIGPGSSIVTTPLTFAATATAALHLGADVVFADVDEDELTMAPDAAARAIRGDTRAIVAVDFAGRPARLEELGDLAQAHDAVLVEDAAHSLGGTLDSRPIGDWADLTTFSFHPVKTITTGEGGAVVVRDREYLDAVRRFRNHGIVRDPDEFRDSGQGPWHQEIQSLGLNCRLPDVLAALGLSQLRRLETFVKRRSEIVDLYRDGLADLAGLRVPPPDRRSCDPAWHLFPVRVLHGQRARVYAELRAAGILVQVHYLPVHMQPLFADLGWARGMFPVTEQAYEELLSLPLYPGMSDADVERVVDVLRRSLTT